MATDERVRVEIGFDGGQVMGGLFSRTSVDELERVLRDAPGVVDCAVCGRTDPRWGEVPVAHVVVRAGASCTAENLSAHVLAQLARFKAPKDFIFAESLPKSALGKVQHHLLRERT